jgi:hypothetical protein
MYADPTSITNITMATFSPTIIALKLLQRASFISCYLIAHFIQAATPAVTVATWAVP